MSGVHDNWSSAVAFNRKQMQRGRFTDVQVAQLVELLQRFLKYDEEDIDGKLGKISSGGLLDVVSGWLPKESVEKPNPFADWVYPMPILTVDEQDIIPDVSSSFGKDGEGNKGRPNHWGIDVMYRRHDNDDGPQERYPKGHRYAGMRKRKSPIYSPRWYCPRDIPIYAVGPGTVWSVNWGSDNNIKIDHHNVSGYGPLCTWYQHCHDIFLKKGDEVEAGDIIGIVGEGSSDLIHLHFEWRDHNRGRSRSATVVDPEPFVEGFKKLPLVV